MTNNTGSQMVYIPKVMGKAIPLEEGLLQLFNTTDHKEYAFAVVDTRMSGLYYVVSVTLEEGMASGEYEYTLYNNGDMASTGLLWLLPEGQVIPRPNIYEQSIEYEQYK